MGSDVVAYWDQQAATFDEAPDHGLRDPRVRAAWARLLTPLLPPAPSRILDVGCGTGTVSVLLVEQGHLVAGVDLSGGMVAAARTKALTAGVSGSFLAADASALPLAAASFDVVFTRHVLWAMPDPHSTLGAWLDLLAPDGLLVLVEERWHTGAGLAAVDATELVRQHRAEAMVIPLEDPTLWGGPTDDERYLLVSRH